MQIRELQEADLPAVKAFCDTAIGRDYYSAEELHQIFLKSRKDGVMCSFLLIEPATHHIQGIRITYPAGLWTKGKGRGLHPELWNIPLNQVGYFQSLFLAPAVQGQGWGGRLSDISLEALRRSGARAVVCHAWRESPNDSSRRYLKKMGFQFVAEHPFYWKDIDYTCTRCGKPCLCTAEEMIKIL
jgi:ribosomal protein S18 acetylase RimI-like enzyme